MPWVNGGASRTSSTAWRTLKRKAIAVFGNECARCGADGRQVRLELDHVVPVAEGGEDTLENAQLLCDDCHKPKTQREAARGRARRKTRRPRRVHPSDALAQR